MRNPYLHLCLFRSTPRPRKGLAVGIERVNIARLLWPRKSWIERNKRKERTVARYAKPSARNSRPRVTTLGLQMLPRDASPTRLVNRCLVTGRRRASIRRFKLSRIAFRELASQRDDSRCDKIQLVGIPSGAPLHSETCLSTEYINDDPEKGCGICRRGFELNRPLSRPAARWPVRCARPRWKKLITQINTPKITKPLSVSDAKSAGFTILERRDKGVYEKL